MLARLHIRDFTIVEALAVDFRSGFGTITGETGAGKSILLDALGLLLGDRASGEKVRPGASAADLTAEFDVGGIPEAQDWLAERDLGDPDAPDLCLLRRTLSAEGRSRAYVNGRPTTLADVRGLADHLIDVHSQHAHQSLLRREVQTRLLDEFGGHEDLARDVARQYRHWRGLADEHARLVAAADEHADRRQLLGYQLEELDAVAPREGELEEVDREHRRLAGAEHTLTRVAAVRSGLEEDDDALPDRLARMASALGDLDDDHPSLASALEMLESARVHAEEAAAELRRYAEGLEPDPERLAELEARLGTLHDLARKHRVAPEDLPALHEQLRGDLDALGESDARAEALDAEVAAARETLRGSAKRLTAARARASGALAKAVDAQLAELGMGEAALTVERTPVEEEVGPRGAESIEFRVRTNAGMPPGPLARIASGGELSRISLAIQVVTARTSRIPSLVLDEADVGIGGGTAEVVGRLLRSLGEHTQVLAVTHLPQVAAQGHHHLVVRKDEGRTTIAELAEADRVAEIARMLGGVEITDQTRAHASEMLERAARAA